MRKIISLILLCAFLFTPYCYSKDVESQAGGIYKISDIEIRFRPPEGWKAVKEAASQLDFQPQGSAEFLLNSLGIAASPIPPSASFDMEKMMRITENDKTILDRQVIDFEGTKAFSSVSAISGLKMRSIQFIKEGRMFTITFMAAEKDFDSILPAIDDSLKTLEIPRTETSIPEPARALAEPRAVVAEPATAVAAPVPTVTLHQAGAESIQPAVTLSAATVAPHQTAAEPAQPVVIVPVLLPPPAISPTQIIAEPFREIGQPSSLVKIALKSGTIVKGKVLSRTERYLKLDFHGVPISLYFNDIEAIEEESAQNAKN